MKKVLAMISTMFFIGANLLALSVGDTANYLKNSSRTSWLIKDATGSLKVIEQITTGDMGPGYVVNLKYRLNVVMRGEQSGDMDIFVPKQVFAADFYDDIKNQSLSLGVFKVRYLGKSSAKDSSGQEYDNCSMVELSEFDHNFAGTNNQAKVIRFNHHGSIEYVNNLNIKFRSHPDAALIGAVEMDISGVSSNGIGFYAGLDLIP